MNRGQRGIDYAHFISLRLCGMRFAGEMICLLTLTWQSNPVLRRGYHPSLAGMLFHDKGVVKFAIQQTLNGGQRGIRTLGDIAATHAFQACSFDHSDICPWRAGRYGEASL